MIPKTFTNQLYEVITELGLDIALFDFTRPSSNKYGEFVQLSLKGSNLLFQITEDDLNSPMTYYSAWYVPYSKSSKTIHAGGTLKHKNVIKWFKWWLNEQVKIYLEDANTNDLWGNLHIEGIKIDDIDFTENLPFQKKENEQIKLALNEIKELLASNLDLTHEQISTVNSKIEFLSKAVNRLKKRDWKLAAIGTIVSISYDLALSPDKQVILVGLFSKLWSLVKSLPVPPIG